MNTFIGYNQIIFNDLHEFYNYISADESLLQDIHLSDRLGRLKEKITDEQLKLNCLYELYIFNFSFEKGEVKPALTYENGSQYPTFDLFEEGFEYIKGRANDETNPKYKAHYNHLLWKSPAKNNKFAKTAVDSYFLLLSDKMLDKDNGVQRAYTEYFQNLFSLSQETSYRKDEVLALVTKNLSSEILKKYEKCSIMRFVVQNGKKISEKFYQTLFDYVDKIIENTSETLFLQDYFYLQILLCKKLKLSSAPYHEKFAELHLEEAKQHTESFVVHDFYLKALHQYRKAGNKDKVEEVSALIEKAKKNLNLKKISLGNDDKLNALYRVFIDKYDKFTDQLMDAPYEEIYTFLILHDIFPKAQELDKNISTVMADLFNTMSFDINGNVSKGKKGLGISPYNLHIQNFSMQLLSMVFIKGIKCGKVSYETLKEYLHNHTWYRQNIEGSSEDGVTEKFDWIKLLLPSLRSFFTQFKVDIEKKETTNEAYILAVDSLVLKFEGLIRGISRQLGAQVIEIQDNGTKERISFEKLLDNQKLQALIPENDIALFKYLFTSQGINLRNNVAHCFYPVRKYNPGLIVIMIVALLRLGNYEFSNENI